MKVIKNGWYVASFAKDLRVEMPLKRTIADEPVVLYRTEAGLPVALDDRCPHRFAPLHMGQVIGDNIQCPYHGLQFASTGVCSKNPHGEGKIPSAAKVKAYPLVERDGLLWIWPGDPAQADENLIADLTSFLDVEENTAFSGEFSIKGHIELVMDNLMDLSHAPFLHPTTLANADDVEHLRFEMFQEGNSVVANHWIDRVGKTSPQFRPFWKSDSEVIDGHANMRWIPPASLMLDVGYTECEAKLEEGLFIHMVHLLTPVSENETRYYWIAARNFALGDDEITKIMDAQVRHAFETEDEPMIEAINEYMASPNLLDLNPVLLPGDAASIRVRRIVQQMREQGSVTIT